MKKKSSRDSKAQPSMESEPESSKQNDDIADEEVFEIPPWRVDVPARFDDPDHPIPYRWKIVVRNRVYKVPDFYSTDIQHEEVCDCFYCKLLQDNPGTKMVPTDDAEVISD